MDRKIREDFGDDAGGCITGPVRKRRRLRKRERGGEVQVLDELVEGSVDAGVDLEAWPALEMRVVVPDEREVNKSRHDSALSSRGSWESERNSRRGGVLQTVKSVLWRRAYNETAI